MLPLGRLRNLSCACRAATHALTHHARWCVLSSHLGIPSVSIPPRPQELDRMLTRVAAALRCHTRADDDCTFYQRTQAMYDDYCERVMRCLPAFLVGTTLIG